MNGIFDSQTSGNNWTPVVGSMLHETAQNVATPERVRRQSVVFEDLELQMARYEDEYRLLVADVGKSYVIPRDSDVIDFLSSHRVLPQILILALPHIRRCFGEVVFALRVTSDDAGWERLFVDAQWPGSSEDAFDAIDRFRDDWWIANMHAAAGHLTFTYQLV